jgi:hypothetical protein
MSKVDISFWVPLGLPNRSPSLLVNIFRDRMAALRAKYGGLLFGVVADVISTGALQTGDVDLLLHVLEARDVLAVQLETSDDCVRLGQRITVSFTIGEAYIRRAPDALPTTAEAAKPAEPAKRRIRLRGP